ncbi:MAG: DegV family EDD domain-containing protein [Candidatus Heimdallarchaeota archaeon]|nr:DegV family EDD domain-containing protein [Candidatus Heimdallarchaeota archaeon]
MKVKLITDSTSQIPVEFAQANNIALIEPLIQFEGDYRKEISEVDREVFVSKMRNFDSFPLTTLASPQDALDLFEQIIKEGYKEAIYLFLTPELSNQIAPVKIAYKKVKDKLNVHFYATGYAATSQAPFVLYAVKLFEEGKSSEEVMKLLDKLKTMVYTIGISSSFDILFKSGKIKKSFKMSFISNLMRLKPLVEGLLDKGFAGFGAGSGYGGAIKKLKAAIEEKTDPKLDYNIILCHTKNEKLAQKLEATAKDIRKVHTVDVWSISPCVANTLGYGAAMVTLYPTLDSLK